MSNLLSVIIPTFKRRDSLLLLLDLLRKQQGLSLEIIVVDQNPPNYFGAIENSAFAGIKRVRLEKPNVSAARNAGFKASSGEFILFIDDDLEPEPDFCSKGLQVFLDHTEIQSFSPLVYNEMGKELALKHAHYKFMGRFENDKRIFSITDTISAAIFYRRSFFELTGGFDPFIFEFAGTAEDQEFFLRMKKRNLPLYYVPFVEVFHNESNPGGCDLRTVDYWIVRGKCMRSWVYRRRIHHSSPGRLSLPDYVQLCRSAFINKEVLLSGFKNILKQIALLRGAIRSSRNYLRDKLEKYPSVTAIDHFR
jgi:GT2 family glycosyltransferase